MPPQTAAAQKPPDTLPANFAGWDKAPDTLPANFANWDAAASPQDFRASASGKIQAYEAARKNTPWYKWGPELPEFTPDESKTLTRSEQFMYGGSPGASEGRGLREGLATYGERSAGQVAQGAKDIAHGEVAKGTHEAISGTMTAATPAMPFMVAGAPIAAARAMAGGYVGSKLTGITAGAMGATPEQQSVAEDIGNLLGGFSAASGLPRALLETPLKELVAKSGTADTLLDLLEKGPKKMAADAIKGWLKDVGASPKTHPITHSIVDDALGKPAPVQAVQQAPPPSTPEPGLSGNLSDLASKPNTQGLYGQYSGKSNLKPNQRQLASPTGSTAPGQKPAAPTFTPKANPTAEDLKFQDQHMAEIIQATLGQMRRVSGQ